MTSIDEYYRKECEKIDASDINAYLELRLDDQDPTKLILDSSWGETSVNLTDTVKAAETVTHLSLVPDCDEPTSLQYDPERGDPDCITGDDLSRIISMTKLKDVDQNTPPVDGDVYIYDNGKWYTFNLQSFVNNVNNAIDNINASITNILNRIAPPEGIPGNARIMYGNINIYSDYTNNDVRNWGVFAHSTSNDIANDEFFA